MFNRVQLKAEAKSITKAAAVSAYVFTLIYLVINWVLTLVLEFATGSTAAELSAVLEMDIPFPTLGLSPLVVTFISILISLISSSSFIQSVGFIILLFTFRFLRGTIHSPTTSPLHILCPLPGTLLLLVCP